MIAYRGTPGPGGCKVEVLRLGRKMLLPPRLDLANHSPTGFEWGYGGSGPAQLSLALLAHATGDDVRAKRFYQMYKAAYIQPLKMDVPWLMSQSIVLRDLRRIEIFVQARAA